MVTAAGKLIHCAPVKRTSTLVTNANEIKIRALRHQVRIFLESDDNSTMAPGKRDTITRNKIKMRKRFLNNSLLSLHKKFLETSRLKTSYPQLCRFKPFWIVTPDINKRDTYCLCIKHSNFEMMLTSLSRKQVISERNTHDLLEAITCSDSNVDYLMKKRDKCSNKSIRYTIPNASDSLTYHKWIDVVEKEL